MTVRPGEDWGRPAVSPADCDVVGDDSALGRAITIAPGALVRLQPDAATDVARAIGLTGRGPALGRELPMDALRLGDGAIACNMVVLGAPPDRLGRFARRIHIRVVLDGGRLVEGAATTVLVAIGQFLRGLDVAPRGHPGDGRAEVQVYRLQPRERAAMRRRLRSGLHVPHPRILERTARTVEIHATTALPLEADGQPRGTASTLLLEVVPSAYRLLI